MYCILCDDAPGVDDLGFCRECRWIYRAEVEEGWWRLRVYLAKWAEFRAWELAHIGRSGPAS